MKGVETVDQLMQQMIEKSRTIDEKRKNYKPGIDVDEKYLKEWRDVRTLLNDEHFKEMLKIQDMSQSEFSFSLQPTAYFEYGESDQWLDDFLMMLNEFPYDEIDYMAGVAIPAFPFLYFLRNELEMCMGGQVHLIVEKDVIATFIEAAQAELFNVLGKLIALELEFYKKEKSFISEDKADRFKEFMRNRFDSKESFLEFYAKYPVAARVATVRIKYLKANFECLLKRLEKDFSEISEFLKIETQKLTLTQIEVSTGDSHQQGNAVAILHFENKKLVYKPRNLQISEAFQAFLNWCQMKSNLLNLKIPNGIYHETYTYQEYIEKTYCHNEEEVEYFYTRYGYLVAICYLLGINDLHLENLLAMGEHPVIVDIETMFQPMINFKEENLHVKLVKELELNSVSNSCLLPKKLGIGIEGDVEMSALNGKEAKIDSSFFAPANVNTDEFRYEKKDAYFKGGDNIPMLDGHKEVDYQEYLLCIVKGFNDFMQLAMDNKEELIDVIAVFKDKVIRFLSKGTEQYASMIRYGDHPNYNIEMKYKERLMMNIWAYPYADKRIVSSEVNDMLFNDIPIFFAKVDSRHIIDSRGKVYENYFERSGFDDAVNRIRYLNEKEIKKQRLIMMTSLGLANPTLNEHTHMIKMRDIQYYFDYVGEAERIGEMLASEMIVEGDEASFVNIDCDTDNHWKIIACNEGFYSGLSGIATFFLLLYQKTKKEKYLSYYQKLMRTSIMQGESLLIKNAFSDKLSLMYPMLLEYKMMKTVFDQDYISETIGTINNLSEKDIENIVGIDYISGISGILRLMHKMSLFSHIATISNDTFCLFMNVLKKRIENPEEETLTRVGIAHGLSGLALSLSSWMEQDSLFIERLLEKEMKLQVDKENSYKWCWGLSGMIQVRITIIKDHPNSKIKRQLSELIQKYETLLEYIPKDDTLCHGNGSILTTLKYIFEYTGDEKWQKKIHVLLSNMIQRSMIEGYGIPTLFEIEAKGLFDGLSGVGFSYLYAIGDFPNVLLLDEGA